MSDSGFPLPPPSFEFLIFSLKTQAEIRLGLLPFGVPEGEENEIDLPSARHAIDLLGMLSEKTRGNLSMEEQRLIENSLTELRFRFIQASQEAGQKSSEAAETKSADAKTEGDLGAGS